jgi:hypothetical protein
MAILKKTTRNTEQHLVGQSVSWGSLIIWVCMLVGLLLMMVRFSHIYY